MDTGTSAFMLISTALVFLMTPALAFFYGGLSRRKNVVNTMYMSFGVTAIVGVTWTFIGWSLAYGGNSRNPIVGGFNQIFGYGLLDTILAPDKSAAYPPLLDFAFQLAFAFITASIIGGALAGRMRFTAFALFIFLWSMLVYPLLAHMVWSGDESLIGGKIGALDFAGGDVVHISSGLTGLIVAIFLGKRRGYGSFIYRPHNVPAVALSAGLLWFGWFGFNAGSAFSPDGVAVLALVNTMIAPTAAMLSWIGVEWIRTGSPTLVGASSGIIAGLVVITPGAGFVDMWAAMVMGFLVSPICYWAISYLKPRLGYDDALDAFGLHGIGGIVGGIFTGIFCVPELSWTKYGGLLYTGDFHLLWAQILGIIVTVIFVGIVTCCIVLFVRLVVKELRVSAREEAEGVDVYQHHEAAYPAYDGLD